MIASVVVAAVEPIVQPQPQSAAPTTDARDAEYLKKLDARVTPIVASLGVDQDRVARLHPLIVAQYRAVNAWHDTHDVRLKELVKVANSTDGEKSAAAKREIEETKASLKSLHDRFLAALSIDLRPDQIEKVKDGMTVGKVQFTYGGYLQQNPNLTEEQKAKVLGLLKDAREEAIDAGSMDEKSAIFNQYKGKINNYLVSQGVVKGKGHKDKTVKNGEPEMPQK